jgi:hypothetical protein
LLNNGAVNASAATNQHATTEEVLKAVFSVWSAQRLYSKDQRATAISHELQVSSGSSCLAVKMFIDSSRHLATTSDERKTEDFVCAVIVLIYRMRKLM